MMHGQKNIKLFDLHVRLMSKYRAAVLNEQKHLQENLNVIYIRALTNNSHDKTNKYNKIF